MCVGSGTPCRLCRRGLQALCEAANITTEERDCRDDVLYQMNLEFVSRLSDYHCEFPCTPDDILFIIKLYIMTSRPKQQWYLQRQRQQPGAGLECEAELMSAMLEYLGEVLLCV